MKKKSISILALILLILGLYHSSCTSSNASLSTSAVPKALARSFEEYTPEAVLKHASETESDIESESNTPSLPHGTPLNEAKDVFDLDYKFKKDHTDQLLLPFDSNLLVLQQTDGLVTIYLYDPLNNKVLKNKSFPITTYLSRKTTAIVNNEIRIYDTAKREFLFLDKNLLEKKRIQLPEEVSNIPVISNDGNYIYYFALDGSGLKQLSTPDNRIRVLDSGLILNRSCSVSEPLINGQYLPVSGDSNQETEPVYVTNFLNSATGEIVKSIKGSIRLWSTDSAVGAIYQNGLMQALYDLGDTNPKDTKASPSIREMILQHPSEYDSLDFDLANSQILTASSDLEEQSSGYGSSILSLYNLENGKNTYQTRLSLLLENGKFASEIENIVYLPSINMAAFQFKHGYSHICLWDLNQPSSATGNTKDFSSNYYPSDLPNQEGTAQLKEYANELNEKFGVKIHLADEIQRAFTGYEVTPAYSTRLIKESLNLLEQALSAYPKGFLDRLNTPQSGVLKIYLAGGFKPLEQTSTKNTNGIYYHEDQEQYLVLDITKLHSLEGTIYHEISHAIDQYARYSYEHTGFNAYLDDVWNQLNPPGFSYDYSYRVNAENKNWDYSVPNDNPENVYFIDSYSKSFPSEDRAQIMEHAMLRDQGIDYFIYPHIKKKLEYINSALLKLFGADVF